ncbi:hypothetical protein CONPUDRAFT_135447 [Coniophora puteana RWD-64-598 SS2]|uniref:C2H2-type domain-containing protein n=1 Tax=Coniophora puteana (strain RWD-64-598) TaxID=741705 RepID=A0A5M3MX18_CONPW|nr:uncharacterized protein CONPUDRAFT_135447 [Coniophora puteana RWD-64-598 SS2]EIW83676.1 hypothetical protein CONPUDRAFT_135447 [Coniophora puteana RWD-64-598 SS2]
MTASRSVKRERSQSQSLHDSNSVTSCDSDGDGLPQAKRRRGGYVCGLDGCKRVCGTAGDLRRHHQSLRHGPPEFRCLACKQTFTRLDALRRHLKLKAACRRVHNRLEAQAVTIS